PFAPFGKRHFHFHFSVGKIDLGWNQREAALFRSSPQQFDLFFVKQQFAFSSPFRNETRRFLIGSDVHIVNPDLTRFDAAVRSLQVHFSGKNAFNLRPDKHDAAFVSVQDFIVVPGTSVLDDRKATLASLRLASHSNASYPRGTLCPCGFRFPSSFCFSRRGVITPTWTWQNAHTKLHG